MILENYFSINYLLRWGYFDFKTISKKMTGINEEYSQSQIFHKKIFTCDHIHKKFSADLEKLDSKPNDIKFDIDTIPIEFTIYKNIDSRRIYKMPNMYSYIRLIKHISENKNHYISIIDRSEKSISKYFYSNSFLDNIKIREKCRFGKRYLFTTDIQEFYPSIYTHSIPWVLVTKKVAKANRDKNEYFNRLDSLIQRCQYGETQGIPTGTFASRVISEIYMCKIDEKLRDYNYVRYVDDFQLSYNEEIEQANFYNKLFRELNEVNLKIKVEKNKREVFPFENTNNIADIYNYLNEEEIKNKSFNEKLRTVHNFIDFCIEKERNGQKGALKNLFIALTKFTVKSNSLIIYKTIISRLLNLVIMKPILGNYFIDLIDSLNDIKINNYVKDVLNQHKVIIEENMKAYIEMNYNEELHSILSLYYFFEFYDIKKEILLNVIENMDDFNSILSIEIYENICNPDWTKLFEIVENKLDGCFSWKDEFWLLKYEIFYKVKNKKSSLFTAELKEYIWKKYAPTKNKNKFITSERERKKTNSPLEYLCQKKSDDKYEKNSNIWRFYDMLLKNKVSFLYRNSLK
ncbi:RNA-directed DNA polymerase [Clostridioides difficile]|nr:RNA-directed DNA polymerase [Clostridioides difficile]